MSQVTWASSDHLLVACGVLWSYAGLVEKWPKSISSVGRGLCICQGMDNSYDPRLPNFCVKI